MQFDEAIETPPRANVLWVDCYLEHHDRRPAWEPIARWTWLEYLGANGAALAPAEIQAAENRLREGKPVQLGGGAAGAHTLFPATDCVAIAVEPYVKGLRLAAAALHAMPEIGYAFMARHQTARAHALVAVQAAVAMAEGRPFDPAGTDLIKLLGDARDGLGRLIQAALERGDSGEYLAPVRATLAGLINLIGTGDLDAAEALQVEEFRATMAGETQEPAAPFGRAPNRSGNPHES